MVGVSLRDLGRPWLITSFRLENRYPGIRCDIPSVVYQYIWNPKVWSEYYSQGAEIFNYFKNTVNEYDLWKFIRLRHRVDRAEWNAEEGQWHLSVTRLQDGQQFEDTCDIFVNCMGFLKYVWFKNVWHPVDKATAIGHGQRSMV